MGSNNTDLAVIVLDSAIKKADKYYPQVLLKECKYIEKKVNLLMTLVILMMNKLKIQS